MINKDLSKLQLWLNINRQSLNISKTIYVIFHPFNKPLKHRITIKIKKKAVSWKQQIKNISCKISRLIVQIMCNLSLYLNSTMLKNIYYSLNYSHSSYAVHIWGSAGKTEIRLI